MGGSCQGSRSDWKTSKNRKAFSKLEITQNTGKVGKFQTNIFFSDI